MHVRCVCGVERIVWLEDLEQGRSTGCESRRCSARFLASQDMRSMLTHWLELERDLLLELVHELRPCLRKELERAIATLCTERLSGLDDAISEWLRAQPQHDLERELEAVSHA